MKLNLFKKEGRQKNDLRSRLLAAFIVFGAALLILLWVMQSVFLEKYYQSSMRRKCKSSMNSISSLYSNSEQLDYDSFCAALGSVSTENEVYFYVEASDGSFAISSSENDKAGKHFSVSKNLVSDARKMLGSSPAGGISFSAKDANGSDMLVYARKVSSEYRRSIYLYAVAYLTPMGPAVSILRSQLLFVTLAVLVLGMALAYFTSRKLSAPIAEISKSAKALGEGNFDVEFRGEGFAEIEELAETLNNAAAQLKATDSLQKDFMANVSHDLRTPLTMIKSYAEMIRDLSGDNKEKREEHLGVIIEETDRLADLVSDILELSRVQSGTESFEEKEFDLQQSAEDIFQTYRIMEQEGYEMRLETLPQPVMMLGDEARIKQVISNLVSNAVKYSEDDKFVRLYFEADGENRVKFCVEDHGIGVPEDQQEGIWNRYQRSSQRGARSKEGSGLGLSICSEILKRHGARYGLESTPGEGSVFWFSVHTIEKK